MKSTATKGSDRDSESLEYSETVDSSQSETVGFFEERLEQADRAEPRRGTSKECSAFFGEVSTPLAVTEAGRETPKQ